MKLPIGKPWFGPRRFGFGVSPMNGQGWACIGLYILTMAMIPSLMGREARGADALGILAALLGCTALLLVVVWLKMDRSKPLRWRWGED
ncbi:hypothetical protein [Phenylobacterium sp.]|jgi:hypothetical protein|uniref:hypothetical protein n=1 Tax=Phenylobacterium sp. TaxID=1871053 RepID=UPI0025E3CFE5|nr:hypothetical protein [Phenylobacterium sp.]MCA3699640.1 hypothetical protein [Brevundimonas sp.]MCA6300015.1 hypothetical protein [Phenylobacterium sp.]MCA6311430.1 hypothetical protein [Phenylobacterium sp.]MCA6322983.1 hypothetical protein [Phenylobacterium sp.]MCA6337947.1 hypothetical protein [Phenylobacterium sp.]